MNKISKEVAVSDFELWAEHVSIDTSVADMEPEDRDAFEKTKRSIIKRIMAGSVYLNDSLDLVMKVRGTEREITFPEPKADILSARLKNDSDDQAQRRMLAHWVGVEPKFFSGIPLKEFVFCGELFTFFVSA